MPFLESMLACLRKAETEKCLGYTLLSDPAFAMFSVVPKDATQDTVVWPADYYKYSIVDQERHPEE